MKKQAYLQILFILFLTVGFGQAQDQPFELEAYRAFLGQHQNMMAAQLLEMHPAGTFMNRAPVDWESVYYGDSVSLKLGLTDSETGLIGQHGFVVTERLKKYCFSEQFLTVWRNDLPVFISTDAILHAFHFNYVNMLKQVEKGVLMGNIQTLLTTLHNSLPELHAKYAGRSEMDRMINDLDVYLTVPRKLFDPAVAPLYEENAAAIEEILALIDAEQFAPYPFFSETCKEIDFSQFKPRGHYADDEDLSRYFRVMIWLGRTEIYLIAPKAAPLGCPPQTFSDVQRQVIDAVLIKELIDLTDTEDIYGETEQILSFLVGEQDNVTLGNLTGLIDSTGLSQASDLLDSLTLVQFQDTLRTKPFAGQKILSQVLAHDPFSPESLEPASAFMLFGQRFIIDSYVTGSVVYDKIKYNNTFPCRLFPSTQDILFALGNDASAQLLRTELETWHYASNLTALRYLVDSYSTDFWESTIHAMWLNAIRALNAPAERMTLPGFMQTAAWWQEKMNTQLASWTQLRHDHLLYAKQSYSAGVICSYPCGYVEPIPEFYGRMGTLSVKACDFFSSVSFLDENLKTNILNYFGLLKVVSDTLGTIACKELAGTMLTEEEQAFLKGVLFQGEYGTLDGWYMKLLKGADYYGDVFSPEDMKDYIVADYHTTPTDCFGIMMGWVSHAGVGPVDMAILAARDAQGRITAYAGPVMSYYEYRTTNFLRLTDQEWEQEYLAAASRPDWVNIYLADSSGSALTAGAQLCTSVESEGAGPRLVPSTFITARNYPNPFNGSTIIYFIVPYNMSGMSARLSVYDVQGRLVNELLNRELPSGSYLTKWDGTDQDGHPVASGLYIYKVQVGSHAYDGKMILVE